MVDSRIIIKLTINISSPYASDKEIMDLIEKHFVADIKECIATGHINPRLRALRVLRQAGIVEIEKS